MFLRYEHQNFITFRHTPCHRLHFVDNLRRKTAWVSRKKGDILWQHFTAGPGKLPVMKSGFSTLTDAAWLFTLVDVSILKDGQ